MKVYKNVGTSTVVVDGSHPPGDVFSVEMPLETEAFLTQIGAIVEVTDHVPAPVSGSASAADNGADAPVMDPELYRGDEKEEG